MENIIIDVSKKEIVNGKSQYVKQGEVPIVVPVLTDIAAIVAGAKITGTEDGLPVYEADEANWVQSAMLAYVKANARNKLKPGTAILKDGLKIPTNWAELCAEGERGGNGAALQLAREVKDAFATWANTLGKSAATVKVMVGYFSNKTALELATPEHKGKLKAYVEQFAASLDAETLERYERPIESVMELCDTATVDF